MVDQLDTAARSRVMGRIRSTDTQPEHRVREAAHHLGLRFRLHRRDLPGTPDLVFPKHKLAVFVHGCFWHRHPGCKRASMPAVRTDFWVNKFSRNVARDAAALTALTELGWKTLVIWECESRKPQAIVELFRQSIAGKDAVGAAMYGVQNIDNGAVR